MDIKLVVTDLDGTLLNDLKEIDPSFWPTHQQLLQKGVLFSVASGRQIHTIEKDFERIAADTLFIAENGTLVRYRGEDLYVNSLETGNLHELLQTARQIPGVELVLCGRRSAYMEQKDPLLVEEAGKYYHRLEVVDRLDEVQDEVLKLALYDKLGAENNSAQKLQHFGDRYKVTVSGEHWLDVTNLDANKGNAVRRAQEKLGIGSEQTMVFGDFLNDLEMMEAADHSYAMKNAHPIIRERARFITNRDNNHNGVVDTVVRLLLQPQAATFSRE